MKIPPLTEVNCKYGAPMGRADAIEEPDEPIKFNLVRLPWVDYDYDPGGAYWGYVQGDHIYRAVGEGPEFVNEMFVRAKSRGEAKMKVKETFKLATFYR